MEYPETVLSYVHEVRDGMEPVDTETEFIDRFGKIAGRRENLGQS